MLPMDGYNWMDLFFKLRMNSTENSELLQQKQNTEAHDKD